jgi:hypothetical protein
MDISLTIVGAIVYLVILCVRCFRLRRKNKNLKNRLPAKKAQDLPQAVVRGHAAGQTLCIQLSKCTYLGIGPSSQAKEIWLNPKYHLGGKFTARLSLELNWQNIYLILGE